MSREFEPHSNWDQFDHSSHFAQFYETDPFLLNSLSQFVGSGLAAGDACIVVATDAHRAELDQLLQSRGLDVSSTRASGQYVSLDAADTLSKFMIDGSLEPELFSKLMGGTISRAADGRGRVRVFGEMVSLLWSDNKRDAAIRLEGLWNGLHEIYPFSLFCAYPMNGFDGQLLAASLGDVCAAHSQVIPTESYTSLTNGKERFLEILRLQQKARSLEAEIKERERVEEQLRLSLTREQAARAEAECANRTKDEFLATVSHELRTPLNAIIGWSYMLRAGRLDDEGVTRALETIERNAKAQAQLIEDILDVSRVITGKLRLRTGPVDMAAIINAATDSVQLAADSKGIKLAAVLDSSARHTVGDANRLQQVIWNLLSNAIRFTPPGGRVEVGLSRTGQEIQIRVSDTGPGIEADFLPFIFDQFRQADPSNTRQHGGLGLGLSIVRHLVELHGGRVNAVSPGDSGGATFNIILPACAGDLNKTHTNRPETLTLTNTLIDNLSALKDIQVLLVDDDRDTLELLAVTLREQQAKIEMAASASDALAVLEWYSPDVLVTDLAMPGEDGYSLIEKVRSMQRVSGKSIPAIALTSSVRVEDRSRALGAGFNMFVPKPIEPNELMMAIASLAAVKN